MTNFERIKAMSIDEMAEFLCNINTDMEYGEPIFSCCLGRNNDIEMHDSYGDIKEWLESEVE